MTIDIDHYQDSGPLLTGRGTTTTPIDNVGWMSNSGPEGLTYAVYPIIRPTATPFTYSFDYYTFFKFSGTYAAGSRPRIQISGSMGTDQRLYYQLTDTYNTPLDSLTGGLIYYPNSAITLYPRLSITGPNANLGYPQYLSANTTYYTEYLHTRVLVMGTGTYQNIDALAFTCYVDEYEENDL